VTDRVLYEIAHEGDDIVLREGGIAVAVERNGEIMFDTLFKMVQQRAFAALPDDIRIHAASGIHEGRTFLLVGNPHAGKTTLAIRLLEAGMDVVGDELVMLRNGQAAAYPRKFYLRESSFDLLPRIRSVAPTLPLVVDSNGMRRIAIDPPALGHRWRIARLPVGGIFYLDPHFGMPTKAVRSTKIDMVRLVMEQCTPPPSGRRGWIGDLCAAINNATTQILAVGDLDSAAEAIRKAVL
jgi:hypothetical protein